MYMCKDIHLKQSDYQVIYVTGISNYVGLEEYFFKLKWYLNCRRMYDQRHRRS